MSRQVRFLAIGSFSVLLAIVVLLIGGRTLAAEPKPQDEATDQDITTNNATGSNISRTSSDDEIQELIEKLGSDSYATRIRARRDLQRMGLEAFDALREAQMHSDSEILSAARFLISNLHIGWSKESDPLEVREALSEYGAQDDSNRESRIRLLAGLPNRKGLEALIRLARFESNSRLSQLAAQLIMQQPSGGNTEPPTAHAERMRQILQGNSRQASQWLLAYASDLEEGTYNADRWEKLIRHNREQLDNGLTQTLKAESILELVRVCAARAVAEGKHETAMKLAIENIDLVPARTRGLVNASQWAIKHEMFPFVTKLRAQHQHMFDAHSVLLYSAAQAAMADADDEAADLLAKEALKIRPFPANDDEKESLSDKELQEIGFAHLDVASELRDRGLFDWAEREYRLIIDAIGLDSGLAVGVTARNDYAGLCAELLRHDDVVKWLMPLAERAEKDKSFQAQLGRIRVEIMGLQSKIEYHRGMSALKNGDKQTAKTELISAFRRVPDNINILIEMYRLKDEDDKEWTKTVNLYLTQSTSRLDSQINRGVISLRRAIISSAKKDLANSRNEYAWLVSNTEGDFARAIRESKQSLDLVPGEPEYMDTLARCYFAYGDFESAVKYQKEALEKMPHTPSMVRQLAEFEEALAKSSK